MKKSFYAGLISLVVFEVLKVYLIMPMPGSQQLDSVQLAYVLHTWRWGFRVVCLAAIGVGARAAFQGGWRRKWIAVVGLVLSGTIVWMFNFVATADHIFKEPQHLVHAPRATNRLPLSSIVIAVEFNGEAKAWPIRYLVYHHQVHATVGGKTVLVTYCSVCRTGRVYEPVVNGRPVTFRLVGMDHFNAMFEDATTGSWWRQANGEAVTGPLQGVRLPVVPSSQTTLRHWLEEHPAALVMQPDESADLEEDYDTYGRFERGKSKGDLTRTDPLSWQEKSWVVGVQAGRISKAYDWNRLKKDRVINDRVGDQAIVLVLATDGQSFAAFERPAGSFTIQGDIIAADGRTYDLAGRDRAEPAMRLKPVQAHQEFWHSWRTFHPGTLRYEPPPGQVVPTGSSK